MRRARTMRFAPGMYVFPGGGLEDRDYHASVAGYPIERDLARASADEALLRASVACGVREVAEETGVELAAADLHLIDHWVTPVKSRIRFDVRFFMALTPSDQQPMARGTEMDHVCWMSPQAALAECDADQMPMLTPTVYVLEYLSAHSDWPSLVQSAHGREVRPLLPERLDGANGGPLWRITHAYSGDLLAEFWTPPPRWEGDSAS